MAEPAKKRATYQDVLNAPPHTVAEIINGELHVQPRPHRRHVRAASVLGIDLGSAFDRGRQGPGGWVIVFEPELHFDDNVLVPDIAGWRSERYPAGEEAFYLVAPDWICEVLSPRTEKYDRAEKLHIYGRAGVSFAWLVAPDLQLLEVYRRQAEMWTLVGTYQDDAKVRAVPFDALELELGALWQG